MDADLYDLHLAAGRAYGRRASCGLKIDYGSEASALKAVERMANKARKPLEAYPCVWCNGWHLGRVMSIEELRWAAAQGQEEKTMELFGQVDPNGGDGYVPGAWDEVRQAYQDGHISLEAYAKMREQMSLLRGYRENGS